MIQEIGQWLETNLTLTIGTDLYIGHRPQDAPARCSVLLERVGGVPNFFLTDKVDYALQVLSRSDSYMTARDDAIAIYAFIHGASGWTLPVVNSGDAYFLEVAEAQAYPAYIGQDDKGNHEWSCNYIIKIRNA
jgi:hypothetical protein